MFDFLEGLCCFDLLDGLYLTLGGINPEHGLELSRETVAEVPFRIASLYEARADKPVDHVVELADAHVSL